MPQINTKEHICDCIPKTPHKVSNFELHVYQNVCSSCINKGLKMSKIHQAVNQLLSVVWRQTVNYSSRTGFTSGLWVRVTYMVYSLASTGIWHVYCLVYTLRLKPANKIEENKIKFFYQIEHTGMK